MEMYNVETEKQGSVLRGLVGALIGAVLGAAVWGVVGILTQRVFSLLGILLGFLCAKGYELLKGREGVAKIVIVILCVILAVVLGEAIFAVGTFHQMYVESIDTAASELEMYGIDLKKLLEENPAEAYDKYLYTEAEMFKMALEDQSPATISIGRTETENLNFVRHYVMNDDSFAGDNFGDWSSGIKGYAEENDPGMQIIKFTRPAEDKKDIIMVNWQGHPSLTGGILTLDMSADYVGATRQQVEYQTKANFVFFQGASGNQNVISYIPGDSRTTDYQEFGKFLTEYIISGLEDMTPVEVGEVHTLHHTQMCEVNREMEDHLDDALRIQELYSRTDRDTGNVLAQQLGFSSVYHANGVVTRSKIEENELPLELNVYAFGDISFVAAPYEMFAKHGMQIKEGTPYEMTFVSALTNGHEGYLPTEFAFQFGCYESHTTRFTGDTGTKCAEAFISMLETMKAE